MVDFVMDWEGGVVRVPGGFVSVGFKAMDWKPTWFDRLSAWWRRMWS